MRSFVTFVALAMLGIVPVTLAAPVGGGGAKSEEIGPTPWKTTLKFRGGERAMVLVANKSKALGNFHVAVYDAKNNLVAEDKNKTASVEDLVGVIWYPPRDAEYRIEIKNLEMSANGCYVTIK